MTAPSDLRRLVYVSRALMSFDHETLQILSRTANHHNKLVDVSAIVCYSGSNFLQVLEGKPQGVDAAMGRIVADRRHTDIAVLIDEPCQRAMFAAWHWGLCDAQNPEGRREAEHRNIRAYLAQHWESDGEFLVAGLVRHFLISAPVPLAA